MTRADRNFILTIWMITLLLIPAILFLGWSVAWLFFIPVFGGPFIFWLNLWLDGVYERRRAARERKSSTPARFAAVPRNR